MDARLHRGVAPRAPVRAMPVRPLRAADQGPFDWLVPFIPPFLRVNKETREQIWAAIGEATSPTTIQLGAERVSTVLRVHAEVITKWIVLAVVWTAGLMWVQAKMHELATAYVILSAFLGLCVHVMSGETTAAIDINGEKLSAYSVFNRGARRMMGSLSAEQFENEIRHRGPGHDIDDDALPARHDAPSDEEDDDPDLLEALRQSLEEKKREERRLRRTQRRR